MRIIVPSLQRHRLTPMILLALCGALIAGVYGALHDQISYTISPEYFTRLKFRQFRWADAGWTPRVFASIVGFLATWWAGLFAGWFLARVGLDLISPPERRHRVAVNAFSIILCSVIIVGALGAILGYIASHGDMSGWNRRREELSLHDVPRFVIVAWLHAAGYLGALLGIGVAIWYVRRQRATVVVK